MQRPSLLTVLATTLLALPAAAFQFTSTDTPLAIPPTGTSGTTVSTIQLDVTAVVTDLNVGLDLTHTWVGDLRITLEHQDTGTSVVLFARDGSFEHDISNVLFDDEAADFIDSGAGDYNPGSDADVQPWRPDSDPGELLSSFDGESLFGSWTLTIEDLEAMDRGELIRWSLQGSARRPGGGGPTIPEPTAATLFGLGALLIGGALRRR